jgi:outer membrane biosynthesis protein TonB
MRKLLFVAVTAALSIQYVAAQQGGGGRGGRGGPPAPPPAPPPAGLECFDNLPVPEFPKAALQAKVDGTVWVNIEVGAQGAIGKMEPKVTSAWANGTQLLTPPVEAALHSAKVKPECAGKNVLVVFRYELNGEAVPNPQVSSRKEPPYLVWIESQPMTAAAARK